MQSEFCFVGFENSSTLSTLKVWPSDYREYNRSCVWLLYSLVRDLS